MPTSDIQLINYNNKQEMKSLTEDALLELKKLYEDFKRFDIEHSRVVDDVASGEPPTSTLSSQVLTQIAKIDEILAQLDKDCADHLKVLTMKAALLYENGKLYLNTNDMQESKIYLEEGVKVLTGHEDDPQVAFLHLRIINHFSYVLTRIGEVDRAKSLLEDIAEKTWSPTPTFYTTEDLFTNQKLDQSSAEQRLKKLLVNNMQMLAWIYGNKSSEPTKYADQVHKMLSTELELEDADLLQWSIKCYRLGSFYIMEDRWREARYHLAAAQTILDPLERNAPADDALFRAQADLARVWVNYCLQLFTSSRKSHLENLWDESTSAPAAPTASSDAEPIVFEALTVAVPDVPCAHVSNLSEAKSLFGHANSWLKRASFYYTLRDHPLHHVGIVLESSELYRHLSYYETSNSEKYSIQKKRCESLEALGSLLREVRPNHYLMVCVDITREIVEVQIEMMNLNLKRLYEPEQDGSGLSGSDLQSRVEAFTEIHTQLKDIVKDEEGSEAGMRTGRAADEERVDDIL